MTTSSNDGICCSACNATEEEAPGVPVLRFLTAKNYAYSNEAARFEELRGLSVKVEIIKVPLSKLEGDVLNVAAEGLQSYDGFITPPQVSGGVMQHNGWVNLSPFIFETIEKARDWSDIMLGYRRYIAQYDNNIIMYPLDGDIISLFYRKDVLNHFNLTVPRTWDEYEQVAARTHGKVFENITLSGSCVTRKAGCALPYWINLLLSSITQTRGPTQGHILDTSDLSFLMGDALVQVIEWLETQVQYGADSEFDSCILGVNEKAMSEGKCVVTYNWGNSFKRYLSSSKSLRGKFGVAPSPGSTKVLDRETGALVECTEELCPYADFHEDLGWVNRASYLAFGGWACAVSQHTSDEKKRLASEFCAFLSSAEESRNFVLQDAQNATSGGENPFRRSHLMIDDYVELGYERETAQQYIDAIDGGLDSSNVVVDLRVPTTSTLYGVLEQHIHPHLSSIKNYGVPDHHLGGTRRTLVNEIETEWRKVISEHDAGASTSVGILESYQRLRGIYTPEVNLNQIASFAWVGFAFALLVIACSIGFALWSLVLRNHPVVRASQPFFLVMICIGAFIIGCTIFPMALDDGSLDQKGIDRACMSIPWLITVGWTILFSGLFAKLWRLNRIHDSASRFRRVELKARDVLWPFCVLLSVNTVILTVWTVADPLLWKRIEKSDTESYGICTADTESSTWKVCFSLVVLCNFVALILVNWEAYKARKMNTEYSESKFIALSMLSYLQLFLVSIPTLFLVPDNPRASFFVRSMIIVGLSMSVLLVLFVPKVYAWWKPRSKLASQCAYNSSTVDRHSIEVGARATVTVNYKRCLGALVRIMEERGEMGVDFRSALRESGLDSETFDFIQPTKSSNNSPTSITDESTLQNGSAGLPSAHRQ